MQPQPPPPLAHQQFWRWFRQLSRRTQIIGCGVLLFSCVICTTVSAIIGKSNQTTPVAVATASPTQAPPTAAPTATPTATPTTAPTATATTAPTPTHAPKWTTTHTFTGNGNKKTAILSVPDDWRIVWSCQGLTDGTGIDGYLLVSIINSDGSPYDSLAVSATCKYGKVTTDNTEEHQSGNVYLETITGLLWKIQVQELK